MVGCSATSTSRNVKPVTLNFLNDMSDRKLAEGKLVFQASLLNYANNAIIATYLDGKITYWNTFAESMYQWTSEEIMGKNISETIIQMEKTIHVMNVVKKAKFL